MKFPAIFVILLVASFVSTFKLRGLRNDTLQQQLLQEKAASSYSRITNGVRAGTHQFPYQVGLLALLANNLEMRCGGALISNEWVLTAAHCIIDCISVDVYVDSAVFVAPQIAFRRITRRRLLPHENYNRTTFRHDIGLIRVRPLTFSDTISAVTLPTRNMPSHVGSYAYHAGWGYTSDATERYSPNLLYYTFRIITNNECSHYYVPSKIYPGKICTAAFGRISGCVGDSGGPLVLEDDNIIVGINSFGWGRGCELGYPTAFTRVSYYLNWIHAHPGL